MHDTLQIKLQVILETRSTVEIKISAPAASGALCAEILSLIV